MDIAKYIEIEGQDNIEINQTIEEITEPDGLSIGGISLSTGYGWGIDISIILIIVAMLYVAKKFIDKWVK
jgi:hypothetical protein